MCVCVWGGGGGGSLIHGEAGGSANGGLLSSEQVAGGRENIVNYVVDILCSNISYVVNVHLLNSTMCTIYLCLSSYTFNKYYCKYTNSYSVIGRWQRAKSGTWVVARQHIHKSLLCSKFIYSINILGH